MAFDRVWERVHTDREWGFYPKEELVRFVCGTFTKPGAALDLGCGQGASAWFLAREGFDVAGIDGSATALAKAYSRLSNAGLPFRGAVGCLTKLPYKAHSFDLAVDVVSSAHNRPQEMFCIFEEVARVLKPGGKLFSMIPTNRCSRRPFVGLGTVTFTERREVDFLLDRYFDDLQALPSSYYLAPDCRVENWVITATAKLAKESTNGRTY